MIATRVTESYAKLFLNAKGDNPHVVIDRVGAYEVRLLEIPSTNARGAASLWVELYDRGLRAGVDSCKCKDVVEAIEVTRFFMTFFAPLFVQRAILEMPRCSKTRMSRHDETL
jgi:hypothetical protein